MKRLFWMMMGMLVVIGALTLVISVGAKKNGCPDDQKCTWAIKYDKDGE